MSIASNKLYFVPFLSPGLTATCDTILDAELWVEYADTVHTLGQDEYTSELKQVGDSAVMHFRISENTEKSVLKVRSSCGESCVVSLHLTAGDQILRRAINSSETKFEFCPYESVHYVTLRLKSGTPSSVTVRLEELQEAGNLTQAGLTRETVADFFKFEYKHLAGNSSKSVPLNLTAGTTSVMRFKVGAVYDTGGALFLGLKIAGDEKKENADKDKVVLVGCVSYGKNINTPLRHTKFTKKISFPGYHSEVTHTGNCGRYDNSTGKPADLLVTNSTSHDYVHVPYPEPGVWHLSVRAYCVDESECGCFEECARGNSSGCDGCECARDCEARAEVEIGSESCVGKDRLACNGHGKCAHYMSGGFVFAACDCHGDYRGFDCVDDEYVLSQTKVWTRLLLLTLSNLAFIGAIFVAVRRGYHTEAVVYAAVMIFSTLYHACEGGDDVCFFFSFYRFHDVTQFLR